MFRHFIKSREDSKFKSKEYKRDQHIDNKCNSLKYEEVQVEEDYGKNLELALPLIRVYQKWKLKCIRKNDLREI